MSVITVVFKKLLAVVCGFFSAFRAVYRKAVCHSRSGRRMSGSILPMTADNIQPEQLAHVQQSLPSNEAEFESWDAWGSDTGPRQQNGHQRNHGNAPAGYHGNSLYRSQSQEENQEDCEPETDYFQDMIPEFRRPAKILIKKRNEELRTIGVSSRLGVTADVPPPDRELGAWEEGETTWGDETLEDLTWQAESAIKETRLLEREQRQLEQQRRKLEKDASRSARKDTQFSAVKLS